MNTYLASKGYTVLKSELGPEKEDEIKKELTVAPFAPPGGMAKPVPFQVYRENTKKLYLPRAYAQDKLGVERENRLIQHAETIDLPFEGSLRDYQNNIIDTYLSSVNKNNRGCGLLEIPCGRGKCLARGTLVMMANRKLRAVECINEGDYVMGDDYTPRQVWGVTSGKSQMILIWQDEFMNYMVNDAHILTMYDTQREKIVDIPVMNFIRDPSLVKTHKGVRINPDLSVSLNDIRSIELVFIDDRYYGFCIGGNHRFLLGDGTVTHNTVMALNIISRLSLKTIVVVHKTFLLNQWIERIQQFLPSARIGTIQGKTIDIENKDIVIGMLQSLSMKEYPSDMFSSFGLSVFDECHHISAEVFSKSLFKVVTPYSLGLSATMNRKDGLTKVFKMFLGDIVYSEARENNDKVIIYRVNYQHDERNYAETIYNFKGQTHYTMMIKKLCEWQPRIDVTLNVLREMREKYPGLQIMILAHNKSLLKILHDTIENERIATVGYYVGGMKEHQLKESEDKEVIIATFAMAEEALDIKTLAGLILATPKTDVVQAVGRILRQKREESFVVDIVDQHDIFQKQWVKRRRFYTKCDYHIREKTIQNNASLDELKSLEWETMYDPNAKKETKRKQKQKITQREKPKLFSGKCLLPKVPSIEEEQRILKSKK